jgi:protein phosphatase 1 regulatory subunit 7
MSNPDREAQENVHDGTEAHPEDAETAITPSTTVRVAQVQGPTLPVQWTQMGNIPPTAQLRYPGDVMELDVNDTEIIIVGTAGQKITKIGEDFSASMNPNLSQLVLRSQLIRVMEGLEHFVQLDLLELYDNQVEELACLGDGEDGAPGKTLRVLDMSYNVIRDMQPVMFCPNLQELYLANNKLRNMAGLGSLTKLRKIDLGANRIREMDAAELAPLVHLEELWLGKNKIERIEGLSTLKKLRRLDIQSNRLTQVENLTSQTETLEELYLAHNGIATEGTILPSGLGQTFELLNVLDLSRNRLTQVNQLGHLKSLEELWLSGNKIATFDDVQNLSSLGESLQTVYLEYNPLQEDPLYRKKLAELIPSLSQIDATLIGGLGRVGAASGGGGGVVESEEARVRRLQDIVVARAQAETDQKKVEWEAEENK